MTAKDMREVEIPHHMVWVVTFFCLGVFIVQATLYLLYFTEQIPLWILILGYIISFALFVIWEEWMLHFEHRDLRMVYLPLILLIALGPFGALVMAICGPLYLARVKYVPSFTSWYNALFPKEFYQEHHVLYERIRAEREDYSKKGALVPFMDVMKYGSEKQKGEAITKILQYFDPKYSPALVMGLSDPDPVIRVRAATAVARLEEDFMNLNIEFERLEKEDPHNPDTLLYYAQNLEHYLACTFIGQETRDAYLTKAISLYQRYLEKRPLDEEAMLSLAALYLKGEYYDKALNEYQQIIKQEGLKSTEVLEGYLETLFRLKQYEQIREISLRRFPFLDKDRDKEINLRQLLNLWRQSAV